MVGGECGRHRVCLTALRVHESQSNIIICKNWWIGYETNARQMKIKVPTDEDVLVLGGRNLYNIAKVFEYSCVDI